MDAYTLLHVAISLASIVSGFVVLAGMMRGQPLDRFTGLFIGTTVATSSTGFGFPFDHLLPSHFVGIISLVVLAIAIVARYGYRLAGSWRRIYVITATLALYFNVFVLVVQLFRRVPGLTAIAPTQSEPPFAIAQFIVLAAFVYFGVSADREFREPSPTLHHA